MPKSRLQPFSFPSMASASSSHRDPHMSLDLSPTQQHILDHPNLYHDTFARSTPHDDSPTSRLFSNPYNPIATFFRGIRSRYAYTDVENVNSMEDDSEDEEEMNAAEKRKKWDSYEETPMDKWFTLLCLMLLLSLLFNIFLVFNGPVHCLPHVKHHKTEN